MPVLIDGALTVWESLAICEYANELAGGIAWPEAPEARALARAMSTEMHAGFDALRQQWPMQAASSLGLPVARLNVVLEAAAHLEALLAITDFRRAVHRLRHGGWRRLRLRGADGSSAANAASAAVLIPFLMKAPFFESRPGGRSSPLGRSGG